MPQVMSLSSAQSTSPLPVISGLGNLYSHTTFPLSIDVDIWAQQMKAISALEAKVSVEKLQWHEFLWVNNAWLPHITEFWKPSPTTMPSYDELWQEYDTGIGNRLSLCQLTNIWGARWKRNIASLKVEGSRRLKFVTLVEGLCKKVNGWTPENALEYLNRTYPIDSSSTNRTTFRSSQAFMDWLQKKGVFEEVVNNCTSCHAV